MNKIVIIMVSFILALTAVAAQEVDNNYYYPRHIADYGLVKLYDRADGSSLCNIYQDRKECLIWVVIENNWQDVTINPAKIKFLKNFNYKNATMLMSDVNYINEQVELEGFAECQYEKLTTNDRLNCDKFLTTKKKEVFNWQPLSTFTSTKNSLKAIGISFTVGQWDKGEFSWEINNSLGSFTVGTDLGACGTINTSGQYVLNTSLMTTGTCLTITSNHTEIFCNSTGMTDKSITYANTTASTIGIYIAGTNQINITIRQCYFSTPQVGTSYAIACLNNCPYNLTIVNVTSNATAASHYFFRLVGGAALTALRETVTLDNVTMLSGGNAFLLTVAGIYINNSRFIGIGSAIGHPRIENTIFNFGSTGNLGFSDSGNYDTSNIQGGLYNVQIYNATLASTAGWLNIQLIKTGTFNIINTTFNSTTPTMTTYGIGIRLFDMANNFTFANNTFNYNQGVCYAYWLSSFESLLLPNIIGNRWNMDKGYNCTHANVWPFKALNLQYIVGGNISDNTFNWNITSGVRTNYKSCRTVYDYASSGNIYQNNQINNNNSNGCLAWDFYYPTNLIFDNLRLNITATNISINATLKDKIDIRDSPNIWNEVFNISGNGTLFRSWTHITYVNQSSYGYPIPDASVSFFYIPTGEYFGGGFTDATGYTPNYFLPQYRQTSTGMQNMSYISTASTLMGSVINSSFSIIENGTWYAQLGYDVGYVNSYESKCTPYLNAGETSLICTYKAKSPSDAPLLGATGRWNLTDSADNLISTGTIKEFMLGTYWFNMSINSSLAGAYKVSTKMSFTDSLFLDPILILNNTRMCVYDTLVVRQT